MTPESFRRYFEQYGPVVDSTCMMDKETGNPRGFGFVTFKDESSVDQLLAIQPVNFEGKMVSDPDHLHPSSTQLVSVR